MPVNQRAMYDAVRKEVRGETSLMEYEPRGLGYLFYNRMLQHKEKGLIAQIDATTGHKDSFADFLKRCIRTALKLKEVGIKTGDMIMICSYNHLNSGVPFVAAQLIGAIVAPTDPTLSLEDTKHLVNLVKPKLIFVSEGSESLMEQALEACYLKSKLVTFALSPNHMPFSEFLKPSSNEQLFSPYIAKDANDTCLILFSSGTTGLPKGICLSHNFVMNFSQIFGDQTWDSIILGYASLYWVSAISILSSSLIYGCTRLVCRDFQPELVWTNIRNFKVKVAFLAPVQVIKSIPYIPSNDEVNLETLKVGGSIISPSYMGRLKKRLKNTMVLNCYGQTEIGIITSCRSKDEFYDNLESCGLPVPNMTIKITDPETTERLGPNQVGEICVKARYCMNGYYNQDSSDCFDAEGFIKTGDLGYFDDNLCFYITDRIKEMFKYNSWHIVPAKLEEILNTHPDVELAAVIGIPHPVEDNHAMGLVTLTSNAKVCPKELELYVEKRVDDRHRLRAGIKFLRAMPLTPTGKIKRRELRDNMHLYLL